MPHKDFNIENGYLSYNLSLYIPPGKKETHQMVPSDLIKTKKKIQNTHIS